MADETMSIVKSASQRLASLLDEEHEYLYKIHYKIEKLQLDLEWCRGHILQVRTETKKNQFQSNSQEWISQIREFGYEAGEILDKYMLIISRAREDGFWNALVRSSPADCEAKALREVGCRVDALSRRVSELSSKMTFLGVQRISSSNWIYKRFGTTIDMEYTRAKVKYDIVGFEENVAELEQRLVNPDEKEKAEALVIYGQPGCGKTTLANMVYHSKIVRDHFDSFIWVPPQTQYLGGRKILELIWLELYGGDYYDQKKKIKNLEVCKLKSMIQVGLRMKKLLVVFDDVRDEESSIAAVVRAVSSLMTNRFTSSKVMLTTSSEAVQRVVTNNYPCFRPKKLNNLHCGELLKRIIGFEEGSRIDGFLNCWGNSMIQCCQNLPLAILMLGGILASKNTVEEWEHVYRSIQKTKKDSVLQDLTELSYSELPPHIRSCFLHLGNLPKNLEIPANQLYRLWMAEGLVRLSSNEERKRPEDIAQDYLNELVDRGLVKVVSRGKTGKVKAFWMHDAVRRVCHKKATELSCYTITSTNIKEIGDCSTTTDPETVNTKSCLSLANTLSTHTLHGLGVRILDGHQESKSCIFPVEILRNCQHLKSLLFLTNSDGALPRSWLKSLVGASKFLRVLHLEDAVITSLPEQIGGLVHLMYLSLRGSTVAHGFPPSIGNLLLLETLDLRVFGAHGSGPNIDAAGAPRNSVVLIPNVLWKLKRLRHLFLPKSYVCKMFSKLHLSGLTHLEILKNLNLRRCKIKGLFDLLALRKISWEVFDGDDMFELRDKKRMITLLQSPNVRLGCLKKKLTIKLNGEMLSNKNAEELAALEGHKKSVEGLVIWGPLNSTLNSESVKKVLATEHLTNLVLRLTELEYDPMPILENLQNLKNLRLSYRSYIGTEMTCHADGFCRLVHLKFDMLPNLLEWRVERGSMPELKLVELDYCRKLQRLPSELAETVEVHCLFPCIHGHSRQKTCPYYEEPRDQDIACELASSPCPSFPSSADDLVGVVVGNNDAAPTNDVNVANGIAPTSVGAATSDVLASGVAASGNDVVAPINDANVGVVSNDTASTGGVDIAMKDVNATGVAAGDNDIVVSINDANVGVVSNDIASTGGVDIAMKDVNATGVAAGDNDIVAPITIHNANVGVVANDIAPMVGVDVARKDVDATGFVAGDSDVVAPINDDANDIAPMGGVDVAKKDVDASGVAAGDNGVVANDVAPLGGVVAMKDVDATGVAAGNNDVVGPINDVANENATLRGADAAKKAFDATGVTAGDNGAATSINDAGVIANDIAPMGGIGVAKKDVDAVPGSAAGSRLAINYSEATDNNTVGAAVGVAINNTTNVNAASGSAAGANNYSAATNSHVVGAASAPAMRNGAGSSASILADKKNVAATNSNNVVINRVGAGINDNMIGPSAPIKLILLVLLLKMPMLVIVVMVTVLVLLLLLTSHFLYGLNNKLVAAHAHMRGTTTSDVFHYVMF